MRPVVLAIALSTLAMPAAADLRDEADIRERLLIVGEAEALVRGCGAVRERRAVGIQYLWGIARMALAKGYTRAEIEAYVEDDAEKDRLRAIARERVAAKGGTPGDEAALCRLAQAEIAAGSPVGRLLR